MERYNSRAIRRRGIDTLKQLFYSYSLNMTAEVTQSDQWTNMTSSYTITNSLSESLTSDSCIYTFMASPKSDL
jgi:hypothetical protein